LQLVLVNKEENKPVDGRTMYRPDQSYMWSLTGELVKITDKESASTTSEYISEVTSDFTSITPFSLLEETNVMTNYKQIRFDILEEIGKIHFS
jgi:hypothetical protein